MRFLPNASLGATSLVARLQRANADIPEPWLSARLPALLAGSMLRRTAAFCIILKMLPARRAYPARAGQPVAAAPRGLRPSPYPW